VYILVKKQLQKINGRCKE